MPGQQATDGSRRPAARARRSFVDVWPPLPPAVYARRPAARLPFPLGDERTRIYPAAPHALAAGLAALAPEAGDEVLVPALCDRGSVAVLLDAGLVPRFFDAGPSLEPDASALDALVGPRTRALYLLHPLGLPQDAERWRAWCERRGLLLIEDAARAWLASVDGRPVGSFGALAVLGLREAYGLPAGAALVCADPPGAPRPEQPVAAIGALIARHGAWAKAALGRTSRAPNGAALPPPAGFLLERLAADDAAAGRRQSWTVLQRELGDRLADGFAPLPPGAAPFCFPLQSSDGGALIARCAERGIRAVAAWPAAHPAASRGFPVAAERRATTVGLPVHQELTVEELDRVIDAAAPRRARPPLPRLEPVERLEDVAADFDRLALAARNLFAGWDWVSAWWSHHGAGRRLATFAVRDAAGRTIGLLPAYVAAERPLRALRLIGHGPFDWMGPVCAPADVPALARAIHCGLRSGALGADVLLGEQLPAEQRWGALLGGSVVARDGSPVLEFDGGFDAWLASRSRNFRDQVRRRERKLLRAHALEYRLTASERELDRDLDTLLRLHGARWGAGETEFADRDRAFHREVALAALRRGQLRLWTMLLDGQPAAAWLGYRFAGTEWYYQSGRDPALERLSVGFVLLAHTVRAALDDGVRQYRLLRGGEEYKSRFANRDPGLETVVAAGSGGGRLAAVAAVAAAAAPARARRWVRAVTD